MIIQWKQWKCTSFADEGKSFGKQRCSTLSDRREEVTQTEGEGKRKTMAVGHGKI